VGTEHLLLALLGPDTGLAGTVLRDAGLTREQVAADIERLIGRGKDPLGEADAEALRSIGIDLDAVRAAVEDSFGPGALQPADDEPETGWRGRRRQPRSGWGMRFSPRAKKVMELSLREAIRLRHNYIGSEHLLLGLLREGDGLAVKIMVDAGHTVDDLRQRTIRAMDDAA
jgi:ATP-dependent Clp protease ATP-binding subunit ClpA